jgi:hypothetical protein
MSNTTVAVARFRMSALSGIDMLAAASTATAHTGVVSAYKPSADARNAVQGGADAWGPPV